MSRPEQALPSRHESICWLWYPDPTLEQTQRYWDGDAWSDHRAPMPEQAKPKPKPKPKKSWVPEIVAGALLGILLVWCGYQMFHADDALTCEMNNAERSMNGQPELICDPY
jgi:hypothetical protein